jgi:hypothetical protein
MGADTVLVFKRAPATRRSRVGPRVLRSGRDFVAVFWPTRYRDVYENLAASGLIVAREYSKLVARHRDRRGVFAFADIVEPDATSYRGIVEEIGIAGVWLPMPRKRPRRAFREPSFELPRAFRDAARIVTRELPAIAGAVALSGEGFVPERVVQTSFTTRFSAAEVAKIFASHLSARGSKVKKERLALDGLSIAQVIARSKSRVVTAQAEESPGKPTQVRVTTMVR